MFNLPIELYLLILNKLYPRAQLNMRELCHHFKQNTPRMPTDLTPADFAPLI